MAISFVKTRSTKISVKGSPVPVTVVAPKQKVQVGVNKGAKGSPGPAGGGDFAGTGGSPYDNAALAAALAGKADAAATTAALAGKADAAATTAALAGKQDKPAALTTPVLFVDLTAAYPRLHASVASVVTGDIYTLRRSSEQAMTSPLVVTRTLTAAETAAQVLEGLVMAAATAGTWWFDLRVERPGSAPTDFSVAVPMTITGGTSSLRIQLVSPMVGRKPAWQLYWQGNDIANGDVIDFNYSQTSTFPAAGLVTESYSLTATALSNIQDTRTAPVLANGLWFARARKVGTDWGATVPFTVDDKPVPVISVAGAQSSTTFSVAATLPGAALWTVGNALNFDVSLDPTFQSGVTTLLRTISAPYDGLGQALVSITLPTRNRYYIRATRAFAYTNSIDVEVLSAVTFGTPILVAHPTQFLGVGPAAFPQQTVPGLAADRGVLIFVESPAYNASGQVEDYRVTDITVNGSSVPVPAGQRTLMANNSGGNTRVVFAAAMVFVPFTAVNTLDVTFMVRKGDGTAAPFMNQCRMAVIPVFGGNSVQASMVTMAPLEVTESGNSLQMPSTLTLKPNGRLITINAMNSSQNQIWTVGTEIAEGTGVLAGLSIAETQNTGAGAVQSRHAVTVEAFKQGSMFMAAFGGS